MSTIYVLSGAVHSGKTTRISEWISGKENISGILQPVINGRRYMKEISSGEQKLMEVQQGDEDTDILFVGRYKFSGNVFTWARDRLILSFNKNPEWLIIDEFGKLELSNRGLEPAISSILSDHNNYTKINIVFVIRDYLVVEFLKKYSFTKSEIKYLEL